MSQLFAFNKPYQVLSQFSPDGDKRCLADFIKEPGIYAAGRLDYDSEGLMLFTDDGVLQHQLSHPKYGTEKSYWVQVDGAIDDNALERLTVGVPLKDGPAVAKLARVIEEPQLWLRNPPIRIRKQIPTTWLELVISEGRNRQVRRMTAAVGHPTLRLVRNRIGDVALGEMQPGDLKRLDA